MRRTRFLNVDIELEPQHPLRAIAHDLGEHIIVLHEERSPKAHVLNFEVSGLTRGADWTVNRLCRLIERLGDKGWRA